jgi:putative ABC transport system substrate-binding protein
MAIILALAACAGGGNKEPRHFTIGLITNNENGLRNIQGFQDGMAELGYIEGKNVTYLFDGVPIRGDMLDSALQTLVNDGVDLIFTAGTPTGVAAHRVTTDTEIPVIFGVIANPIEAGVLTDLTHPGGNVTGVMLSENQGRRLEFLLEIAPNTKRVYLPYDHTDAASQSAVIQIRNIALELDLELIERTATNDEEVAELLGNIPETIDSIFLVPGTTVNSHLKEILDFALRYKLPVSAPSTIQVEEGALITYGFIHYEAGKQAAHIAIQVLNGTEAGEIPVEIAETFLAINLDTADAIDLEVPYPLLQQAQILIHNNEQ